MKAASGEIEPERLRRIAEGNGRDFQVLYDAFAPRVYQYAMLRTGCAADAEEILQETMLAVWNGRSQVASRDSVAAWILSIARNKTVDALRRSRARPTVHLDEAIASAVDDGEDQAGRLDVKEIVAQLDDEERDLLLMIFWLGMTYEEVGEALDIPVGTVKSRMHHLRKRLRKRLEGGRADGIA